MAASLAGVSLARALLTLGRARCTGVVRVWHEAQERRVALVRGEVRAVLSVLDGGELAAHELSEPLCAEVVSMFAWTSSSFRFDVGLSSLGTSDLGLPLTAADLVLSGMREAVAEHEVPSLLRARAGQMLQLSGWARALLAARTSAGEQVLLRILQRGADAQQLLAASANSPRLRHTLSALWAFRAITRERQVGPDYALLVRKRRQLRSHASAVELLDLPAGELPTPQAARLALRRLAHKLHPDVLGPDAPAHVHELSTELMGALLRAEAELRSPTARGAVG